MICWEVILTTFDQIYLYSMFDFGIDGEEMLDKLFLTHW